MFYPVKILNAKGKLQKLISSKQLSKKYWKGFGDSMTGRVTSGLFKKPGRKPRDYVPSNSDDSNMNDGNY